MEKNLMDVLPIMDIEHDCILSKAGDITLAYRVALPEVFTLSAEDYENIHQGLVKALRVLPGGSVFHKQDWYLEDRYHAAKTGDAFLQRRSAAHFEGRPFLRHDSYVFLTKKPVGSRAVTSAFNLLTRPGFVPAQTLDDGVLQDFRDSCGQFVKILSDSGIALRQMDGGELASGRDSMGLIERYATLSGIGKEKTVRDMDFSGGIRIGTKQVQLYTLADTADMPHLCGPRINYDRYSTDTTKFSVGFATAIGLLLPCNHVCNQYVHIGDSQLTLKKLESKKLRLQSLANYSRENAIARDAVNDFLNEAIGEQRLPVKAHFNILAWTEEPGREKDIRNMVTSALAQMEATAKEETVGAPQLYWAGFPGAGAQLPENELFDTFLEQATCFLQVETGYRSDPPETGFRFCDRLTGKPVNIDFYDAPREKGITSNLGTLVCGTSGGGKSMTVNHLLRTLYDQGAHCVVVDIGGSYRGLCELLGGYYFTYKEDHPISFNPFYLPKGQRPDTEKKESLKALLVTLWKQENEDFDRSEYVAVSGALTGYYGYLEKFPACFPGFNSFYEYLKGPYRQELESHGVKEKDFDVGNFLYVLRPYYRGGEFDYLLNASDNLDLLNQPFVVIELDNVKDHPILFPVISLLLVEMFISKMRKLAGKRKVLVIDEAWKAITKSGMAEFLKYAFKTMRKFNGVPVVITQELDDLVSSAVIKDAIINNADVKILMDMRKYVNRFDQLQQVLGLSEKAKSILLSVNKENREVYVDLGGQVTKVFKNELCPEEYLSYTTEGKERVKVLEYAKKYGSMEKGIGALAAEMKREKPSSAV